MTSLTAGLPAAASITTDTEALLGELLVGVHQHRLLTTAHLHAMYTPTAQSTRWIRRLLGRLRAQGLLASVQPDSRRPQLWYATDLGGAAAQAIASAHGVSRAVPAVAALGPLRAHTLAVNDVGVTLLGWARHYGDEFGPRGWEHEVTHRLAARDGRGPVTVRADALLRYQRRDQTGRPRFLYRFLEVDRGTEPVHVLQEKLRRYQQLAADPAGWADAYTAFPGVVIMLCGPDRPAAERRRDALLALCRADQELRDAHTDLSISVGLLDDLRDVGPMAPGRAFRRLSDPTQPVDLLGLADPAAPDPATTVGAEFAVPRVGRRR